ncbi:hypothetical protein [Pedobacter sp.]|uniref:hypothetical protein n=1 Tax=Pedobacter sp. TaxID=1411316 RepID=UPI003BA9A178
MEKLASQKRPSKVENLYLNMTDDKRWFVNYKVVFNDGTKSKARKETGLAHYNIALQKELNFEKRKALGEKLMKLILADVAMGVDPQNRESDLKEIFQKEHLEAQKIEDEKISFDIALEYLKRDKGWINPSQQKQATAESVPTMLENNFKTFLITIGKADDLRTVTRLDIKNFIEKHFNMPLGSVGRWSSTTCQTAKGRVGMLFNSLLERDLIEVNPTKDVKIKHDSEKIEQDENDENEDLYEPWTNDEVSTWFEGFKNGVEFPVRITKNIQKVVEVTSYLIHYCFIRKREILRLKMSMIDFDNERFILPTKITKSARKLKANESIFIDIPTPALNALKEYVEFIFPNGFEKDDFLIWKFQSKNPYKYVTLNTQFDNVREVFKAKYPKMYNITNHYALKHTGAIKLFNVLSKMRKTPMEIQNKIKDQCRHATFSQTETYLRRLKLTFDEHREKIEF